MYNVHPPSILEDFPLSQFACNITQVNLTFKSVSTPFWQKYSGVVVVANKHPSVYRSIGISKLEFQNKTSRNGVGLGDGLLYTTTVHIRCGLACPSHITNIRYIWDFNEPSEKCIANINTATLDTSTTRRNIQPCFPPPKSIHIKRVFFGLGTDFSIFSLCLKCRSGTNVFYATQKQFYSLFAICFCFKSILIDI